MYVLAVYRKKNHLLAFHSHLRNKTNKIKRNSLAVKTSNYILIL